MTSSLKSLEGSLRALMAIRKLNKASQAQIDLEYSRAEEEVRGLLDWSTNESSSEHLRERIWKRLYSIDQKRESLRVWATEIQSRLTADDKRIKSIEDRLLRARQDKERKDHQVYLDDLIAVRGAKASRKPDLQ
jgi:hypothetical protein